MAFSYYSPVTVNTSQVPSAQTDFPMLISYTDARLKTVGNGGHVQNANGYDIRPYSDSGLTSALSYELERYNASTGEVIMWVKIASIDVGSIVYLAYGDTTLTTNGSSTSTWNAAYKAVWHLGNGTTLSPNDSTSNARNGTLIGSPTAVAGQIDGAMYSEVTGDRSMNASDTGLPTGAASRTIQAWISPQGAFTANGVLAYGTPFATSQLFGFRFTASNNLQFTGWSDDYDLTYSFSLNTFYHIVCTYDGTNVKFYINGSLQGTSGSKTLNTVLPGTMYVGDTAWAAQGGAEFTGYIDEVRISNTNRLADWITTEYNNQVAPSTFATLGTEVPVAGIAFDAATNSTYQAAASTYSWSHTCTGSDRYLVVGISMLSLAQTVTSITYNSIPLTLLGVQASVTGAARVELWGLVAPSTGSNTIAVTLSGAIASAGVAASYTGVHQTSPTEGFNSAQATNVGAADATVNVTTVANNDWVVDIIATDDTAITVGAGQTSRNNVTGAGGSGADSDEGPKTPAGTVTMSWTNVAALATWSIGAIALRPIAASNLNQSSTGSLLLMGVG